ncbi:MAG TPA: mechanosensitive ion channel protein MscS [Cyanothece sp. UBA12306]|nr:mechanosensitive ion channel protein MscS [Cyanothece sp. UBA12306]
MKTIEQVYQFLNNYYLFKVSLFLMLVVISIFIGQYTTKCIDLSLLIFSRQRRQYIYNNLLKPSESKINRAGTWILLFLSWSWFNKNEKLLNWIDFLVNLAFTIVAIIILSRLFRQFTKVYGVNLLNKMGGEATEILLAVETIFNLFIGLIALTIFAYGQGIPLTGLLAGVSVSGIALSFAAQNTLQQIFGTLILFLDKPFIQGEYIRLPDNTFGRVESIGLRSTKIRISGKNTLLIVPNSKMAEWEIENITRGKKVMVLFYLDFERLLEDYEKSLVRQIIANNFNSFFGIEPNTSNISFIQNPKQKVSRARINYFILGSTKSSIELRQRMIQIAETKLVEDLKIHGIKFTSNEPVITVDSPIPL